MQPGLLRASSAAELLAYNKWYLRLVAPAGRALARLALYNRPMSLFWKTGPRRSASARETRHVASDSIGELPKQGSTCSSGCRPCRYTEIAATDRLLAENRPSEAIAETSRVRWFGSAVFGKASAVPGRDKTVPWVLSETARRSGLASSVARLCPRDHP
ncbi:hypothetical protein DPMN_035419 [Dreissena polymorpha]|uniref:Uncharacterized protein n=1 Tax=Dreissena polymorpha TaxID=45954 RepID=A0A9D4RKZ8_DREPO|nr:hypothetical protein DPMN_035419 [Dreissena polymorpha]